MKCTMVNRMSIYTDLCKRMHGITVPIPIFYRDDLSIDYDAMQRLVAWYLDEGIGTFIFTYTFSQTGQLTTQENVEITRAVASVIGDRAVLIATTQGQSTDAVETVEQLAQAGAHGVFVMPFMSLIVAYDGNHYITFVRDIANQTSVPVLLNAYRSMSAPLDPMITVDAFEPLMACENFIGLKEDINLTSDYRARLVDTYDNRLAIVGGGMMRNYLQFHHLPHQSELGGVFNPKLALRLTTLLDEGRLSEAITLIEQGEQLTLPPCDVHWLSVNQIKFYALGFAPTWKMRPPVGTATQQEAQRLIQAMKTYPQVFPVDMIRHS